MTRLIRTILQILPWLLLLLILSWMVVEEKFFSDNSEAVQETRVSTLLSQVEQMGKIELTRYNFQEVTEIKNVVESIDLGLFKYKPVPDSKAVLISQGEAVGCIDLTLVTEKDIVYREDTIFIRLPKPELCYFKLDLKNSRIYDLQIDYMNREDRKAFMERLYKEAESNIKDSALKMGILVQTEDNAHRILTPLFQSVAQQPIVFIFDRLSGIQISPATD
ncbi:DUF4230 domain-containing protein [Reichenbachiella ulvae]|uniref:DUF4230 domain-containing protein n=1 Tax=Reichenbachiella ulvae TaxID=2980104 RepID=A0ABT3CZT2_9BACT|nr:DUF4230 domain-containing protein [Reichenbachiella ulvae]MCV9389202.1 DUF4230 domain-containing protein [Reichenbachiella ulvae]